MMVYFLSDVPAALRLNGCYVGMADAIPRRVEMEDGEIFVEAVPSDNRMPVNFLLDRQFIDSPPSCVDVYLMGADVMIKFRRYEHKDYSLHKICQTNFSGNLVTLGRQGGVFVCIDRPDGTYCLRMLDDCFSAAVMTEGSVGGRGVLCIHAQDCLAIVSGSGGLAFCNRVKSYSLGDILGVTTDYLSCAGIVGECSYSYDGSKFTLVSGRTVETRHVKDEVRHFAFFESILARADASAYLAESIRARAGELSSYLGDFAEVLIPPQKFYELTGELRAAGLARAEKLNLFRVKFYAADMSGGLVENIREIEY